MICYFLPYLCTENNLYRVETGVNTSGSQQEIKIDTFSYLFLGSNFKKNYRLKEEKDISDYFRLGNIRENFIVLFIEFLDNLYNETMAILKPCEIDFSNPPLKSESIPMRNLLTDIIHP
jgi:hypothetical protein